MRRSQIIMGTGVSIDIPGAKEKVFEQVFAKLVEIDKRFSLYKSDSELSRFRRGEINRSDLSEDMRIVMKGCEQAEKQTLGFFSAKYDDGFEPTGYVKGWAIDQVGELISKQGFFTFCIGIGGDIFAASQNSKNWGIGITNPSNNKSLITQLFIKNGAVATSGNYERGEHIINPKSGKPSSYLASVTVTGPDIVQADIIATACFAAEKKWKAVIGTNISYEALVIDKFAKVQMTDGMERMIKQSLAIA